MDGEKMSAGAAGARSLPVPAARSETTRCSSIASTTRRSWSKGWTRDKRRISDCARPHPAARRHGAVRRGRRGGAAGAAGAQPQEGGRHHLRRQRHEQPHRRLRGEAVDSRDRSARLRDRHRPAGSTQYVPTGSAAASAAATASRRGPIPLPFPMPGGAPPPSPPPPCRSRRTGPIRGGSSRWRRRRQQRRPRQRRGAARHHRRQRRPHRDRPLGARSRSGDRRHRRRIEQAVLPRLCGARARKDGRWHSIRVEVRNRSITCARAAATSRAVAFAVRG